MKSVNLNGIDSLQPTQAQKSEAVRQSAAGSTNTSPVAPTTDQVSVSKRAEEVGLLVEKAKALPDVRQERVEELRQLIESGKYQVSSQQIADAILREGQ